MRILIKDHRQPFGPCIELFPENAAEECQLKVLFGECGDKQIRSSATRDGDWDVVELRIGLEEL